MECRSGERRSATGPRIWQRRALADGLIVTGTATGAPPARADLDQVRVACPSMPLLAGSGITAENARELLLGTHGVIVGTAAKRGGETGEAIDRDRLSAIVKAARAAWTAASSRRATCACRPLAC